MTTPDPLFERLKELPRPAQDDLAAARTLARAEAAFASAHPVRSPVRARWSIPAALALWSALYLWGAVRELGRLFPSERRATGRAVAMNGDSGERGQAAGSADQTGDATVVQARLVVVAK
jgi:hypothetical protein